MSPSFRTFNERLRNSCDALNLDDAALLRAAYTVLLESDPIAADALATKAGVSVTKLKDLLRRRPGVARSDADVRIHGYVRPSLEPTPHAFSVAGRTAWGWCAWDGLFIPRVVRVMARLTPACPVTREPVSIVVHPRGVQDVNPPAAVMSLVGSNGRAANGMGACCPFVHFLGPEDGGTRWQATHPAGCVLNIDQAWQLAQTFADSKLSGLATAATTDLRACSTC